MNKKLRVWNGTSYKYFNFPEDLTVDNVNDFKGEVEYCIELKDKDGEDIYEGDILEVLDGTNKYRNDYLIYPIGTEESAEGIPCLAAAFPLQQRCVMYNIEAELSGKKNQFIIIGNKNENPELIN